MTIPISSLILFSLRYSEGFEASVPAAVFVQSAQNECSRRLVEASHKAGVTTFSMHRQDPQQPPNPTANCPLGRQPKRARQPLKYIHGTMETAQKIMHEAPP